MAKAHTDNPHTNSRATRVRLQRGFSLVSIGALLGGTGGYGLNARGVSEVGSSVAIVNHTVDAVKASVGELKADLKETTRSVNAIEVRLAELAQSLKHLDVRRADRSIP